MPPLSPQGQAGVWTGDRGSWRGRWDLTADGQPSELGSCWAVEGSVRSGGLLIGPSPLLSGEGSPPPPVAVTERRGVALMDIGISCGFTPCLCHPLLGCLEYVASVL